MSHFSLYWKRHYKDLPPAGNAYQLDVNENQYDVQWMLEQKLRPGGIDDEGHKIWVSPAGMVYYAEDLKKIGGNKPNDTNSPKPPSPDTTKQWQNYVPQAQIPDSGNNFYSPPEQNPVLDTRTFELSKKGILTTTVVNRLKPHPPVKDDVVVKGDPRENLQKKYFSSENLRRDAPGKRNDNTWTSNSEEEDNVPKYNGIGTRIFQFFDVDYERPRYVHNDGRSDVFICFRGVSLNKVIDILRENQGSEVFLTNKLSEYGGFYNLGDYESFSISMHDAFPATVIEDHSNYNDREIIVKDIHDTRLEGKPWIPSSEVAMRLAVYGSLVCVKGNEIHRDEKGRPNMTACNIRPLYDQGEYPPLGGEWTEMYIHTHPWGRLAQPRNNGSATGMQIFTYRDKSNTLKSLSGEFGGPSIPDLKIQHSKEQIAMTKGKPLSPKKEYRSIVIDRNYIYLYYGAVIYSVFADRAHHYMTIKRKFPDKRYG